MDITVSTYTPEETEHIGEILAAYLKPGDCIPLIGDMGSGKTCFVKGVARGLLVPQQYTVNSPSFTLINRYPGKTPLYHVDLYRLETSVQVEDIELDELIHGDGITLIEWPQLLLPQLNFTDLFIRFIWNMSNETERTLTFSARSDRFCNFIEELNHAHSRD